LTEKATNLRARFGGVLYGVAFIAFAATMILHASFMSSGTLVPDPLTGHVVDQGWGRGGGRAFITHSQAVICWSLLGVSLLSLFFGFVLFNTDD
jgi:hypothetical protein